MTMWIPVDHSVPMQDQPHPEPGTVVLVWVVAVHSGEDDDGNEIEADASECDLGEYHAPCIQYGGDGYLENFQGQIGRSSYISHWMPLPKRPAAAGSAQ
jgi:hypothetical protein